MSWELLLTKEDVKALKGSIKKWEEIVSGEGNDDATDNCPLCDLYYNSSGSCDDCPVAVWVGDTQCKNTPYGGWIKSHTDWFPTYPLYADSPKAVTAAKKELAFLKNLLKIGILEE